MSKKDQVQGEGNYEAAKEYDDAQRKFVESGKVDAAAQAAKPKSKAEEEDMKRAEEVGRSHAKEEDPAVRGGGKHSGKP
jgi:hypothetical protein